MPTIAAASPSAFSLFHPLALMRTSSHSSTSLQSGLMLDMPTTPTREHRLNLHAALPSPASTSTPTSSQPLPLPASTSSPAASSAFNFASTTSPTATSPSSTSSATVPSPSISARARSWLILNVVPLFSNKYTRLIISLILVTFNLIVLYFAAFSFYLTHFLHSYMSGEDGTYESCSSFPLSLFLVFLLFRSLCGLVLISVRMRDSTMWVNQRAQMSRRNMWFHRVNLALALLSAAFLALGYAWLASKQSGECVQLAKPLVAAVVAYETIAVLWPLCAVALLSLVFPIKSLSPFTPYMPLTSETFTREKRGLTRREIDSLPSFHYTAGLYADDDRRCAVCLADFEAGEKLRQLKCSHRFHQPCVDEWLQKKPTCPLCVQSVEGERKHKFRFNFSRTRRQSSPSAHEGAEMSLSGRSTAGVESVRRTDQRQRDVESDEQAAGMEMV